jgi:hypothetical protein
MRWLLGSRYILPMSPGWTLLQMVEPMGFKSTNCMEINEFCGATWPSKVLKGNGGNSDCPLNVIRLHLALSATPNVDELTSEGVRDNLHKPLEDPYA